MVVLFERGGLVMWPLLALSFVAVAIIIERSLFHLRVGMGRKARYVKAVMRNVEKGKLEHALSLARRVPGDFVLRTLAHGLINRQRSLPQALEAQALLEVHKMKKNLSVLDTIVTAAPLLGILGTVLGIIASFHILGDQGISDPLGVTKGISEALITTAYGLTIALFTLIPLNYFRARGERCQEELENACSTLEVIMRRRREDFSERSVNS